MIYNIDYSILFESPPPRIGERIEDVLARLDVIETVEKISDREARMAAWDGLTTQFSAA
jgi:hypothetical protein